MTRKDNLVYNIIWKTYRYLLFFPNGFFRRE